MITPPNGGTFDTVTVNHLRCRAIPRAMSRYKRKVNWRAEWDKSGNFYHIEITVENAPPADAPAVEEVLGIDRRRMYRRTAHRIRADQLAAIHLTSSGQYPRALTAAEIEKILQKEFQVNRKQAHAAASKAVARIPKKFD